METETRLIIQQRALEALEESTRTLQIAQQLLSVGNIKEAERLRDEARKKRHLSLLLMNQVRAERSH